MVEKSKFNMSVKSGFKPQVITRAETVMKSPAQRKGTVINRKNMLNLFNNHADIDDDFTDSSFTTDTQKLESEFEERAKEGNKLKLLPEGNKDNESVSVNDSSEID